MVTGVTKARTKDAHSLSLLTLWHIWKERNARIFNRAMEVEGTVLTRIRNEYFDWTSARRRHVA